MSTTEQPRQAGQRGARKSKPRPERMLSRWRIPAAQAQVLPPSGDVSGGITDWGMDGNDSKSDCVQAATDHYDAAKAGDAAEINTLGDVGPVQLYCEWGLATGEVAGAGGCPDNGTDPRSWLDWCETKGIIKRWLELDNPQDVNAVHDAMLIFRGVLICVDLPPDAETQFNAHQPWSLTTGESPDPNAGHAILLVKYSPTGDTFVTWGALQDATVAWDAGCVTGAFVIADEDDPAVNLAAMDAYFGAHGAPPAPAPAPGPAPPKPPAPPEGVREWLDSLRRYADDVDAWVDQTFGTVQS